MHAGFTQPRANLMTHPEPRPKEIKILLMAAFFCPDRPPSAKKVVQVLSPPHSHLWRWRHSREIPGADGHWSERAIGYFLFLLNGRTDGRNMNRKCCFSLPLFGLNGWKWSVRPSAVRPYASHSVRSQLLQVSGLCPDRPRPQICEVYVQSKLRNA